MGRYVRPFCQTYRRSPSARSLRVRLLKPLSANKLVWFLTAVRNSGWSYLVRRLNAPRICRCLRLSGSASLMLHWCGIGRRSTPLDFWNVFLFRARGDVVGVSGLYRQPGMPNNVCWVGWFGISPRFWREGFGTNAMYTLSDFARSIGCKELWVCTGSSDDGSERAGFSPENSKSAIQCQPVFAYVLTSLEESNGKIFQTGCARNFQGDCITLCTCMHWHRHWKPTWKGFWVAGFTMKNSGNQLFYLMQVGQEAASQYALWNSSYLPNRSAKSAALDIFGDLYEPLSGASGQPFNPMLYRSPVQGHVHLPSAWKDDIYYPRLPYSNQPKLLIGIPARSFLWSCPKYQYKAPLKGHPRFKFYPSLGAFYKQLT